MKKEMETGKGNDDRPERVRNNERRMMGMLRETRWRSNYEKSLNN